MGGIVDMVTGRSARRQARMAKAAQAEQRALLDEQERKISAIEAGQRALRKGGGRGLLAYIEDQLPASLGGG